MLLFESLQGYDKVFMTTKQDTRSYLRVDKDGDIMGWNYTPWTKYSCDLVYNIELYVNAKEYYKEHIPELVNFIVLYKWLEKAL